MQTMDHALMEGIKNRPPERFATDSYEFKDELGRMFNAYNTMVEVLQEKSALEKQVVSSDRLAAIGRLYRDSELNAFYAAGVSRARILEAVLEKWG